MKNKRIPLAIEPLEVFDQPLSICIEDERQVEPRDLASDYIRVDSIQGQESISQPFQLSVELRADDIAARGGDLRVLDSSCIRKWARVRVAQPAPFASNGARYFRGIITELAMGAPGCYTLTLQSPLQILSLRNRYHIYSDCDFRALLTEVFAQELTDPRFALRFDFDQSLTLTRTQDWLQAGETDMDFIQRIISKAAIHYYFIHEPQRLVLVFSNSPASSDTVAIPGHPQGPVPLRYTYSSIEKLGTQQVDLFTDLRYSVKLMPSNVRSLLTRTEAEWENNKVAKFVNADKYYSPGGPTNYQHHRSYDYGANDTEAEGQLTKICQQISTERGTLSGTATTALLSPGYCFTLHDPLVENDLPPEFSVEGKGRPEFAGKTYVVTKVQHKMSGTSSYSGTIEATSINSGEDPLKQTFLTPFAMSNTQQGSVLAEVLDHEHPQGWRYRSKKNFQPETGQCFYGPDTDQERYPERGCLVRLATGQTHWVSLSRSSQSVPEVGAMVSIGRGSNESEQPELQQILASHGSKVIQPPGRRNASWQANTNWGSSYSTSYGDSISIRYGHNSATDLDKAIRLVETGYDKPGMAATDYGNSSYSKGSSWSVSLSDNADKGVISASISQGSSFNESHADHSYGYSSTNLSENYSEVGKSASVSVIGEYNGSPDLSSPSFVSGKVPKDVAQYSDELGSGDTFNRSTVWNRSISSNGIGISAPTVAIGAVLPSSSYNTSAILGFSESHNTTIGATLNTSLMVGLSFSSSINCASQFSQSLTLGPTTSLDTRIGSVNSVSTTIGSNRSLSTNISDNTSIGLTVGSNTSSQVNVSNNTNSNVTVGSSLDSSAYIGMRNSSNVFVGTSNDSSVNVATKNSSNVMVGGSNDTSVTVGSRNSTNIFVGTSNDTSINVAAKNSTNIAVAASNETSINVAARNSQSIDVSLSNDTSIKIGAAKSTSVSLAASMTMDTSISASMSMKNSLSASLELVNSLSASAQIINQGGPEFKMVNGLTQAEMDQRQQAKLRQTIIEVISGIDAKV